ncbi:MAG: thiamine pyrophosphate-dependent enzyme [Actinomycetota bacterium]
MARPGGHEAERERAATVAGRLQSLLEELAAAPEGALQPQPPVAGAPDREGSRPGAGGRGVVHTPRPELSPAALRELVAATDPAALAGLVTGRLRLPPAAARARAGDGPTVIEALTYRQYGHSRGDPGKYRPQEEVDAWLKRDPLLVLAERLRDRGVDQAAVDELDKRAREEVAAAAEAAKAAPPPSEETAVTDVWADGGATWRT